MNQGVTMITNLKDKNTNIQSIDDFMSTYETESKLNNNPIPTNEQIFEYLESISDPVPHDNFGHYYEDNCYEGNYHVSKCKKCRHRVCGGDNSFQSNIILYGIIFFLFVMIILLLWKK
jgi:hypothetical protein